MPEFDFRQFLDRDPGAMTREGEDRLCGTQAAPQLANHPKERVLLVRLDGSYYVETVESASIAAAADPDFVVAIPFSRLRPLINRSIN